MYVWPQKYSDEVLDYQFDWIDLLEGDTLVGEPLVIAVGGGLIIDSSSTVGTVTTIWISGGINTGREVGRIHLLATTSTNRKIAESVSLSVVAI